jgi:hypothetical protein
MDLGDKELLNLPPKNPKKLKKTTICRHPTQQTQKSQLTPTTKSQLKN